MKERKASRKRKRAVQSAPQDASARGPAKFVEPEKKDTRKIKRKVYEKELAKLQVELVKLQEWIKHEGLKVVVVFEGRDAAGKGGVIKRITQRLNPRVCRVAALAKPT